MLIITASCVTVLIGQSPPPEPVVSEVRVNTPYGSKTYYYLPADAPPQMRAAYKARELAERGVVVVEQAQELKLETVQNERRFEAYRSNGAQTMFSVGAGVLPVTPGTAPPVYPNVPANGPTGNPFNPGGQGLSALGFGSSHWRDAFLAAELAGTGTQPDISGSAARALALTERVVGDPSGDAAARMQQALAVLSALGRMNDPTQRALDRMVETELKADEQLRHYLADKQKPNTPTATPTAKPPTSDSVKNESADLLDAAIRQERSAREREQQAFDRYQKAGVADRAEAKQAWERASQECDDARTLLKVARERAADRSK